MYLLAESMSFGTLAFLVLALLMAFSFEFVNGFHDTANAVATVIYTHTLKPWIAVIWSGCWNLIGVLFSTGGVAFAILALLPVELVVNVGSGAGFAMVFALLISAIVWNLGTWYLGLPASSSHTLIGSIVGVGLANSLMAKGHVFGDGVNWGKVSEVFTSLVVSPAVGFLLAGGLLLLGKKLLSKHPALFMAPPKDAPPPPWIRALLILTCTGVSFAHGSNDGQKGMGLVLLILIGILPATYALNPAMDAAAVDKLQNTAVAVERQIDAHVPPNAGTALDVSNSNAKDELSAYLKSDGKLTDRTHAALALLNHKLADAINGKRDFQALSVDQRKSLRTDIYLIGATIAKLNKHHEIKDKVEASVMQAYGKQLENVTQFVPTWVKFSVAIALGLGTMIGWKRIVVTVGEKIGKDHLTYAQGASAELVAMCTILAADGLKLPVSTTHVLSSGVAGTMAANKSGLQMDTLRNLLLAWVLTLPVCVILGAGTFAAGLYVVLHELAYFAVPVLLVATVAIVVVVRMREKKTKNLAEVVGSAE